MATRTGAKDGSRATRSWPPRDDDVPFIRVTRRADDFTVEGDHECRLGTPVAAPRTGRREGVCAQWHWDGRRLRASVDPVGAFSLFVYASDDAVALSPSLLKLVAIGADTEPDRRALGVFHAIGLFLNDDTPFRRIRTLPPAGALDWDGKRLSIRGDRRLPRTQTISRAQAVEGIIEIPRQILREIGSANDDPICQPLSGGRDSRHILLELLHQGRPPARCVTFQQHPGGLDADSSAARALCRRAGLRHEVLGRPRRRLADVLGALVLTGLCSDEHAQMMPVHDYLWSWNGAVFDGIGGDVLTTPLDDVLEVNDMISRGEFRRTALAFIDGHRKAISRPGGAHARPSGSSVRADEDAVDYIAETIASFADAADPYQSFWFWNRTRREIGFVSSAVFASAPHVFSPFLDTEFVDFGLSLPLSVTCDLRLHDDAIARAFPRFSDIPYADSGPAPPRRHFPLSARMANAISGARLLHDLRPESEFRELVRYAKGSAHLLRGPGEVLQLHDLAKRNMSAEFAERLLALHRSQLLSRAGEKPISVFEPGHDHAG